MNKLVLRLARTAEMILREFSKVIKITVVIGGTVIVGLIASEILSRSIVGVPLMFVEDIATYTIIWVYMVGAIYATYERTHLVGGVTHLLFGNNLKVTKGFRIGASVVSVVACCILSVWSYQSVMWDFQSRGVTQMLFLPIWCSRLSLLVGFSLMAVYFISELFDVVFSRTSKVGDKC